MTSIHPKFRERIIAAVIGGTWSAILAFLLFKIGGG